MKLIKKKVNRSEKVKKVMAKVTVPLKQSEIARRARVNRNLVSVVPDGSRYGKWIMVNSETIKTFNQAESEEEEAPESAKASIISDVFDEIKDLVIKKNEAYGDSVFSPLRVFYRGKADSADLIRIRIDDKLNRLIQGDDSIEADEDIVKDLMGYCALLLVCMRGE